MSSTAPPNKTTAGGSEGARKPAVDTEVEGGSSPGDLVNQWRDDLFGQISRRPVQSLLAAVGAGYLAGGGLGTILTARLLAFGARLALRVAVVPILAGEIERALFEENRSSDGGSPGPVRGARSNKVSHEKEMET
jgi:hypothetical protein